MNTRILRDIGDDMAAIFGRHPDAARLEFRSNPDDDTAADHIQTCEECSEPSAISPCRECVIEGQAAYRREHGGSMER